MLRGLPQFPLGARILLGTEFQQPAELAGIEIEQQLPGLGLHGATFQLHANPFAIGV